MSPSRKVKYSDIDAAVLAQMPKTGRLNIKSAVSGDGCIYCTVCGQMLRDKNRTGTPLKDFQNYRTKAIKDLEWTPPNDQAAWVHCAICEPCNRRYFELEEWKGTV